MSSLFKRLRKKGYLMVGYSLLKSLGSQIALVLERLLTEYQHSIRNEFLYKGRFVISITHIALYIGFTEEQVMNALNELIRLNLINVEPIENLYSIYIDEDEIVDFEKTKEIENQYKQWDFQLYSIQNAGYEFMKNKDNLSYDEIPMDDGYLKE